MADMISIMNAILEAGSEEYTARVPQATQDNITSVAAPIMAYTSTENEFLHNLINRIGMTWIRNKVLKNPLAILKSGTMPLGKDIQEIFTNPAKDVGFGNTSYNLLTVTTPDTYAIYHRLNRKGQYPQSIQKVELQQAFTSWDSLDTLFNSVINSMYSGNEYDEFILMKNTLASAVTDGKILQVECADITGTDGAKKFAKDLKKAHKAMAFPGSTFNVFKAYNAGLTPPVTVNDCITWTPKEDQLLIIRADVAAELDVDVLAYAFHDDKVDIATRTLEVDDFGAAENVYAILCDKSWPQIYDNVFAMGEFYNSKDMIYQYWLNVFQTYSVSMFANAVAFVHTPEPPAGG